MSKLRAIARLLLFAAISTWYLVIILITTLLLGKNMKRSMRFRKRWASNSAALLGIQIELENPPPEGGYLFVANHRSYIDIAVILKYALASIVAKEEVGSWPIIGWGAKATYTVLVKREDPESRKRTRTSVKALLEQGYGVVIFPEGTTFEGPGILPFRPGPFQIAESGPFPVVPVALEYGDKEDAWVGDWGFVEHFLVAFAKKTTYVKVKFGEPLIGSTWQELHTLADEWVQQETLRMRQDFDKNNRT